MSRADDAAADAPFDVAIVGGGLVGASLALALRPLPLRVLLVEGFAPESASQPSFDDRTTAIGNGSRRIFEALGVWQHMTTEASPIRAIHVSDAGRYGFARLDAAEQGIEAFGYVVPNRVLGAALWKGLRAATTASRPAGELVLKVPAKTGAISIESDAATVEVRPSDGAVSEHARARLLVAADGAQSAVRDVAGIDARVEDYDQVAVVVNVAAERRHDGTAFERFTPTGPLAVLPLTDGSFTFVWTLRPDRAREVLALPDATFLAELQRCFGWRVGRLVRAGKRASYPLALARSLATTAARTVLVGNAAQSLHPVAGQGFNLGLRDAAALAECIADALASDPVRGRDVGDAALLARFASERAADRRGVIGFTDGLVKLFANTRPDLGALRNLGLLLFDLAPPAKSALSRVSWGFAGRTPRLARGLALR